MIRGSLAWHEVVEERSGMTAELLYNLRKQGQTLAQVGS
jgi:hypothetical protein